MTEFRRRQIGHTGLRVSELGLGCATLGGSQIRCRMRARQHGQRGDPLRPAVGDDPGEAPAPIMADQMEPTLAVSRGRGNIERIVDQFIR